jgi:hypothetical protein
MLGLSSLSALLGLLVVILGVILLLTRKQRTLAIACLIAGILLIFVPVTTIFLLFE